MDFASWNALAPVDFASWNTLAHFGTKGMKWGQRRYQNRDGSLTEEGKARYGVEGHRSARGVKRDLNKLDSEQAYARHRIKSFDNKIARLEKKAQKASSKGNTIKADKIAEKIKFAKGSTRGQKTEQYRKLLAKSEKMTNRIIDSAKKQGYKISSKTTTRSVNVGRNLVKTALMTAGANAIIGAAGLKIRLPDKKWSQITAIGGPGGIGRIASGGAIRRYMVPRVGLGTWETEKGKKYSVKKKKTNY